MNTVIVVMALDLIHVQIFNFKNDVIFGVDNSSLVHVDKIKKEVAGKLKQMNVMILQ